MSGVLISSEACLQLIVRAANGHPIPYTKAIDLLKVSFERADSANPYHTAVSSICRLISGGFLKKVGIRKRAIIELTTQAEEFLTSPERKPCEVNKDNGGANSVPHPVSHKVSSNSAAKSISEQLTKMQKNFTELVSMRDEKRDNLKIISDMIQVLETEITHLSKQITDSSNQECVQVKALRRLAALKQEQIKNLRAQFDDAQNAITDDSEVVAEREARRFMEQLPKTIQFVREIETFVEKIM